MTNKLIISAAGSGKTTHIIKEALKITIGKVLITTFTEANEKEIIKKFYEMNGCVPENIIIQTWFSFLIQHGVKPYQSLIIDKKVKGLFLVNCKSGIRYTGKNGKPVYFGENDPENYYFNKLQFIYSDKLSKFVIKVDELSNGKVFERIGKIFSNIFIDEVQDMAGYDLDIIKRLFSLESNVLLVGDPRQVTYHTHYEEKYKKYMNGKIKDFIENECSNYVIDIDDFTLNKTYRNNQLICEFSNTIFSDLKPCEYVKQDITGHDGVFFLSSKDVDRYLSIYKPMQLRDSKKTVVNKMYPVMNFGDSKGLTFDRVIIYPTSKMIEWIIDHNKEMTFKSKSKFYVAVTRAKNSVAIVFDNKKEIDVPGIINFYLQH